MATESGSHQEAEPEDFPLENILTPEQEWYYRREQEWLNPDADTDQLLDILSRFEMIDVNRKIRLFNVACARRNWDFIGPQERKIFETTERFADGEITLSELEKSRESFYNGHVGDRWNAESQAAYYSSESDIINIYPSISPSSYHSAHVLGEERFREERKNQAVYLREIFNNPFNTPLIKKEWLTWNDETVSKMAEAIYEELRFGDMPILADALEEAGCDNAEILAHCRGVGEHVRGCWVLDLLLGGN